jgi:hypothetical protein
MSAPITKSEGYPGYFHATKEELEKAFKESKNKGYPGYFHASLEELKALGKDDDKNLEVENDAEVKPNHEYAQEVKRELTLMRKIQEFVKKYDLGNSPTFLVGSGAMMAVLSIQLIGGPVKNFALDALLVTTTTAVGEAIFKFISKKNS